VKYNLRQLAQGNRKRPFRTVANLKSQEVAISRPYLALTSAWSNAAASLMPVYAAALVSGELDQLSDEQDAKASEIALILAMLAQQFRPIFAGIEQWHRAKWIANVKAAAGVDVAPYVAVDAVGGTTAPGVAASEGGTVIQAARAATAVARVEVASSATALVNNAVVQNATLLRSVSGDIRARLASVLFNGIAQKTATDKIARQVTEILQKAGKRGKRIAVQEAELIIAQLTQFRSEEAGLGSFIWRHHFSEHPRIHHVARNGKQFDWDDPRLSELPGILINCRCTAQPVI